MTPDPEPVLEASHAPADPPVPAPAPIPTAPLQLPDKTLWWEVLAVLCVGVIPPLLDSAVGLIQPEQALPYSLVMGILAAHSACASFVVLYILHRSGVDWCSFGLVRPRVVDPASALVLFAALYLLWWQLVGLLPRDFLMRLMIYLPPKGGQDHVWMVIGHAANAFCEELITRAYLITRLEYLTRSTVLAVLLAAVCFASYHLHYGPGRTLLFVFVMGLVFGSLYCKYRRLWPFVLAHMLHNIIVDLSP